jgi:hypothetical protein
VLKFIFTLSSDDRGSEAVSAPIPFAKKRQAKRIDRGIMITYLLVIFYRSPERFSYVVNLLV